MSDRSLEHAVMAALADNQLIHADESLSKRSETTSSCAAPSSVQ